MFDWLVARVSGFSVKPLPLLMLQQNKHTYHLLSQTKWIWYSCEQGTAACYLGTCFADDVQLASALDHFARVTQFLYSRAHAHYVLTRFSRASAQAIVAGNVRAGQDAKSG